MLSLTDYYTDPDVRQRMVNFLGGNCLNEATCAYLTADDNTPITSYIRRAPSELWGCLDRGLEVTRSLWDRESLLVHLDIEYVNFDYPAEPYLDPRRSLHLQHPAIRCLQRILLSFGIAPLHLLSGRGHHLVWRVRRDSAPFRRLAELGQLVDTLCGIYHAPQPPQGDVVGLETGAAFAGIGQVLEFLAHRVLREVSGANSINVQVTEVETDRGQRGREIVSLDLSEYGDPLPARMIRIPFSVYHKPRQHRRKLGGHVVDELPLLFLVPMFEMDEDRALSAMRDPLQAIELARCAPTSIPDQTDGTDRLIEAYAGSSTAAFHRWFYSQAHEPPTAWPDTYDRTPTNMLPPCTQHILVQPNDLLLKPVGMRHVVRTFMALGWHPRHIAGLIRSKFERDFGWGDKFYRYDAATRADFYTRVFAGLIAERIDDLDDFQCEDLQGLGYCDAERCNRSLPSFQTSLWERIRHERLACRPIHGLFLPDEHL